MRLSTIRRRSFSILRSLCKSSFLDNRPNNPIADLNISGGSNNLLSSMRRVRTKAYEDPKAMLLRLRRRTPVSELNNLKMPHATFSFFAQNSLSNLQL